MKRREQRAIYIFDTLHIFISDVSEISAGDGGPTSNCQLVDDFPIPIHYPVIGHDPRKSALDVPGVD